MVIDVPLELVAVNRIFTSSVGLQMEPGNTPSPWDRVKLLSTDKQASGGSISVVMFWSRE